jgi:hypothetical protein
MNEGMNAESEFRTEDSVEVVPGDTSEVARRDPALESRGPWAEGEATPSDVRSRLSRRGSDGAILVLALVFLVAVSLAVLAMSTWAGNSLKETVHFESSSSVGDALGAAIQVEAQHYRYNYAGATDGLTTCTPGNGVVGSYSVEVYCSIVVNINAADTRVVTFYACLAGETESTCYSTPSLLATVSYDDYSRSGSTVNDSTCSSTYDELTCGSAMSIIAWEVR